MSPLTSPPENSLHSSGHRAQARPRSCASSPVSKTSTLAKDQYDITKKTLPEHLSAADASASSFSTTPSFATCLSWKMSPSAYASSHATNAQQKVPSATEFKNSSASCNSMGSPADTQANSPEANANASHSPAHSPSSHASYSSTSLSAHSMQKSAPNSDSGSGASTTNFISPASSSHTIRKKLLKYPIVSSS